MAGRVKEAVSGELVSISVSNIEEGAQEVL